LGNGIFLGSKMRENGSRVAMILAPGDSPARRQPKHRSCHADAQL
jgi:hypothetical protein